MPKVGSKNGVQEQQTAMCEEKKDAGKTAKLPFLFWSSFLLSPLSVSLSVYFGCYSRPFYSVVRVGYTYLWQRPKAPKSIANRVPSWKGKPKAGVKMREEDARQAREVVVSEVILTCWMSAVCWMERRYSGQEEKRR